MKKSIIFFVLVALVVSFSITACFKDRPVESDIPLFSSVADVINPPDEFILTYSLNTFNNYVALLKFETDAVWEVERLGAPGFITVWIERSEGENNPDIEIISAQNSANFIGLAGGVSYNFWANRSVGGVSDYTTLLLHFTKQDIDYEAFTPKI